MSVEVRSAEARRAEIRAEAARLGIDEAYIDLLVERFYAAVRRDARLGPIFDGAIGERWPEHLAKLKAFWASVALNAGTYSGRPVPAHQELSGVAREDFGRWLGLFEQTLRETAPHPEAPAYFLERAQRIARSLQMAMFERAGPPDLRSFS